MGLRIALSFRLLIKLFPDAESGLNTAYEIAYYSVRCLFQMLANLFIKLKNSKKLNSANWTADYSVYYLFRLFDNLFIRLHLPNWRIELHSTLFIIPYHCWLFCVFIVYSDCLIICLWTVITLSLLVILFTNHP